MLVWNKMVVKYASQNYTIIAAISKSLLELTLIYKHICGCIIK